MVRRKRTGLTIKQAFEKKKYWNIIDLIMEFTNSSKNKIKFAHLKYALVRNHYSENKILHKHMEEFFKISDNDNRIQAIRDMYHERELNLKEYNDSIKEINKMILKKRLKKPESEKFSSEQGLRNALARLKKLELIGRISDKPRKGYPYYIITEKGMIKYLRHIIHLNIDKNIPDDFTVLQELLNKTFALSLQKFNGDIVKTLKNL